METEMKKRVFTGMEIFIVVVILGIMSAIVVPQFSKASQQARLSDLVSDLQIVRSQLELFKIQHDDLLPGQSVLGGDINPEQFISDLTSKGSDGLGPYLKKIPKNVFNGLETVAFVNQKSALATGKDCTGWWLNAATGEFYANDCKMNTNY